MTWLEALALGAVQGLTEFLPVSSDGHLTVVQKLFAWSSGYDRPAAESLFFFVMLHLGTLAAILVQYRDSLARGLRGLLGSQDVPEAFRRPAVLRMGLLALVATLPLVPDKLFFMPWIERAFQDPIYSGLGFLSTAVVLALTQRLRGGEKGPAETTVLDALLVGVAQMFAPLPGVSRSGLTIAAALGRGFDRAWSVRFSLMIAVPAILGAAVSELKDVDPSTLTPDRIVMTVIATVVAGSVGYLAIVWLMGAVRGRRLWVFSVYLAIVGIGVVIGSLAWGRVGDAGPSRAVDGAVRVGTDRASITDMAPHGSHALDRADAHVL